MLSRRRFLAVSASAALLQTLRAQTARIDVAAVERERILAAAPAALTAKPVELIELSATIALLTAAFVLTKDLKYAQRAVDQLQVLAQTKPSNDVVALVPFAEAAVASRFLINSVSAADLAQITDAFRALQIFLHTGPAMLLARDRHDHQASAWLLVSSAIARPQRDERTLEENRRLFKKPTLRNQIDALGRFPEELATQNPYRNTLFNFDLLCGVCQMLASPFDLLWNEELSDGPGMRSAAAFVYSVVDDRAKWPALSDLEHFRDLPGRRPGLLLAGRSFNRPEYVESWRLAPATIPAGLEASFPIREPLLWLQRAEHGL